MGKRFDASTIDLPTEINAAAWIEWCEDRRERGKPLTQRAAILCVNKLVQFSKSDQAAAVAASIEHGWTGLFPKHSRQDSWIDKVADRSWADGIN